MCRPAEKEHGMIKMSPPPATASWQKSSVSGSGNCVQVTHTQVYVWVRDSKNPPGPVLGFTFDSWAAFLVGVQRDEFQPFRGAGLVAVSGHS
jgi:hypothetical protein